MSSSRIRTKPRTSPEVEKLVLEVLSLASSGSKVEDCFWEAKIFERLTRLLKGHYQSVVDSALDITFKSQTSAFEILADAAETVAESMTYEHEGVLYDVLLVSIPIIAQTKYSIPYGAISMNTAATIVDTLNRFVVAKNTKLSLAPWLYSIDQIPQSHSQTRQLLEKMAICAIKQTDLSYQLKEMPETIAVLADPRFILCAIAAPKGEPIFVWQENEPNHVERSQCLKNWQEVIRPIITNLLPGCEFEVMLPDAFYTNCRDADKRVRPLSLKAAVNYLETTLGLQPAELSCIVAPFGNEIVDEFRISFSIKGHPEIIYGVIWPLYDRETVSNEDIEAGGDRDATIQLISNTLHETGVGDVFKHAMLFTPEMCEDCGVPLFPNRSAEVVHAEMPVDTPAQQILFH